MEKRVHWICLFMHMLIGTQAAWAQGSSAVTTPSSASMLQRAQLATASFCKPLPSLQTSILVIGKEQTAPIFKFVHKSGVAAAAGIQEDDKLLKIDGQDLDLSRNIEFRQKKWQPAIETSASTGKAIQLTLGRQVADKQEEIQVSVRPIMLCPEWNAVFSDAVLTEAQESAQKIDGLSPENLLIMRVVRNIAFRHTDAQSTGRRMFLLGRDLSRGLAGDCNDLFDLGAKPLKFRGCTYTDNDFLKADALTMLLLKATQVPLDKFVVWRKAESMALSKSYLPGTTDNRREYDDKAMEKLKALESSLSDSDISKTAAIVDLELTPNQKRILERRITAAANTALRPQPERQSTVFTESNKATPQTPGTASQDSKPWTNVALRDANPETQFAKLTDVNSVPKLTPACRERYAEWLKRANPKGFAIAETGGCGFSSGIKPSEPNLPIDPAERALVTCSREGQRSCRLYAIDDQVVWKPQ